MKALTLCLITGMLAAVAGCDRPANPPAAPATRPGASADPSAAKPASTASRKTLQLSPYPLSLSVPEDWSILEAGNVMFLQGPTPSGQEFEEMARIQISHPPTIANAAADRLEKDFLSNKDKPDGAILKVEARPSGKARLLERRAIEKLSDGSGTLVNWTIDVLTAAEPDRTAIYHLNFVALSQARYEKDRAFLESITASLVHDASLETRPK